MRLLSTILVILFCVSAVYAVEETPLIGGDRLPTPEEQAYLDEHLVVIDSIEPNETAIARSLEEMLLTGSAPKTIGLPSQVDNSLLKYFPPMGNQGHLSSCAAFAAAYYFATYTQAKDHDWDASSGNTEYICSPKFIYNLTTNGRNEATSFAYSLAIMCEIGCSSWEVFPYDGEDYWSWPTTEAWVDALPKRMKTPYVVDASTTTGLEAVKQRLANGDICTSYLTVHTNFWWYPSERDGVDNEVYYAPSGVFTGYHSSILVGYDDNKPYVDYRDGITYYGAFLCANSLGTNWGVYNSTGTGARGYYWVAYRSFLESTTGPEVYFNSDRPAYVPRLYALTGIEHEERGYLTYRGGIGPTSSPDFITFGKHRDGTDKNPMYADDRIAVDLTDGLPYLQTGTSNTLFTRADIYSDSSYSANVADAEFRYDLDATGTYVSSYSADTPFTVSPGTSGFATYELVLPAARTIYVDVANTAGPWDGSSDYPFQAIQDGVDDATFGDTVIIRDGIYSGPGNKDLSFNRKLITVRSEKGPASVTIDCQHSGRGFAFDGQETAQAVLDGVTITNGYDAGSGGAISCYKSSPTIRNCVLSSSHAGLSGGGISISTGSEPLIFNCLIAGNTAGENGGGIFSENAAATVQYCTIADNAVGERGGGIASFQNDSISISDTIVWSNLAASGIQLAVCSESSRSTMSLDHCCVQGGSTEALVEDHCVLDWGAGNISSDPLFVSGASGSYLLSHVATRQVLDSPCIDAGSSISSVAGLQLMSTRLDGYPDTSTSDMGYHHERSVRIIAMDCTGTDTTILWLPRPGESYTVLWSTDLETWTEVYVGETGSWTDTDVTSQRRFYRLRIPVRAAHCQSPGSPHKHR